MPPVLGKKMVGADLFIMQSPGSFQVPVIFYLLKQDKEVRGKLKK